MPRRKSSSTSRSILSKRLAALDRTIPRLLRQWGVPGAAIAATDRSQTFFARGYGFRDTTRKKPVTPDTVFAICSCTKAMTAVAAGMLAEDGILDLDRPLREIYPDLRMKDPVLTERITVRDLLSHRSGVPDHLGVWIFSPRPRKEVAKRLGHLKPTADFRTTYQYNNLFYMLFGHVLEEVTGTSWEDFLRLRLFQPLGMKGSQFATDSAPLTDDFAVGHTSPKLIPSHLFHTSPRDSSFAAAAGPVGPAGTVATSALDMCRWLRLHLNNGAPPGPVGKPVRILSEEALANVYRPTVPMVETWMPAIPEFPVLQQAMGLVIAPYRGHRCLYHTGCFGGFKGIQLILPDAGYACAVLLNSDHSYLEMVVSLMIADLLLDLESSDWNRRWRQMARQLAPPPAQPNHSHRRRGPPSRPISDYAGLFDNPLYGPMTIEEKKGKLLVLYNQFLLKAKHAHGDVFQTVPKTKGIPYGGFPVRFQAARNGKVDTLSVRFGFDPEEAVFRRVD